MQHRHLRKSTRGTSTGQTPKACTATTLLAALALAGCSGAGSKANAVEQLDCPTQSAAGCAPLDTRVDTYAPKFSHPTNVTNPLLPISRLESVVYVGTVGGAPFRTETTLLPRTKVIKYEGQGIEALVSQYMAFSDGRLEEIAVDYYAQDDVGAVWYLGEEVADYDETGMIYTHEGTWRAGVEGPIAMNMPPAVSLGDAWLAENAAPEAWEQITVESVEATLDGPSGAIPGCVITAELKLDNAGEEKVFAPGYGEISTGSLASPPAQTSLSRARVLKNALDSQLTDFFEQLLPGHAARTYCVVMIKFPPRAGGTQPSVHVGGVVLMIAQSGCPVMLGESTQRRTGGEIPTLPALSTALAAAQTQPSA